MSCTVFSRLLFHPPMQSTGFNAWKIREGREQQPERAQLRESLRTSITAQSSQSVQPPSNLSPKAGTSLGKAEAGGTEKPPQDIFSEPSGPGHPARSTHFVRMSRSSWLEWHISLKRETKKS